MNLHRALFVIILIPGLALGYSLYAQGRPGEPVTPADARGMALGNTVLGLWDSGNLSLLNPASIAGREYSTLTLTSLWENNLYRVAAGRSVYESYDLPNIQFVFDLPARLAVGAGWQERQSWRFLYSEPLLDGDEEVGTAWVEGRGAVSAANLALAWAPSETLGFGFRASGLIGSPVEIWRTEFDDEDYTDTEDRLVTEIMGLALALGVNARIGGVNLGAYFEYPVLGDVTKITESTFGEVDREDTTFDFPVNLGLGVGWQPSQALSVVGDFRYELWSGFAVGGVELGYEDSLHVGAGIEIVPSRRYTDFFLWRMPWRVGGYYETLYDSPRGTGFSEIGVTVGTGMFFGDSDESSIDVAFQYALRGSFGENGLEEEIFRIAVSFNGSDNWW
ncbi:hypothetical protein KAU45_02195 [bacterium]|nr:hypothetical protein [bacterium]